MILKIFSVYDSKASAYAIPFFQPTTPLALRSFERLTNDPQAQLFANPEDFSLFELGEYDDADASIKMLNAPLCVAKAHEIQKRAA